MARVLVTGASGFIGQQLVSALKSRGDEVTGLVRYPAQAGPLEKMEVRVALGDVTQAATLPAAIDKVDTVYHLAGQTRGNTLGQYSTVNETGLRHVAQACARRPTPPVLVVVSSLAAAGPAAHADRPRTEADAPQPISNYGRSKRAGELAAEALASEVPITIVRPPIVLGPGDRTGLALFRGIRQFRSYFVLAREWRLSVIHVADLAAALMAAADRGKRLSAKAANNCGHNQAGAYDSEAAANYVGQGYYYVASDEQPTHAQLGCLIGQSIGRPRAWAIHMPRVGLWSICALGQMVGRLTRRARYLNFDRAREMTAGHWICSPEKARQELGFACGASLPERILETAQWYRQQGWL